MSGLLPEGFWTRNETLVAIVIVLFCVLATASDPLFFSATTLTDLLRASIVLGILAVLLSFLLRVPCRVPEWSVDSRFPGLCAAELQPGDLSVTPGGMLSGFFTGGPTGDQPIVVGMFTSVLGWMTTGLAEAFSFEITPNTVLDLTVFLGDYIYEYGITAANLWRQGAEVTPAALTDVPLRPGDPVWVSLKATQVRVHPAHAAPIS